MFARALLAFLVLPGLAAVLAPPFIALLDPWRGETWLRGIPLGIPSLGFLLAAGSVGIRQGVFSSTRSFWSEHAHFALWFLLGLVLLLVCKYRNPLSRVVRDQIDAFRRNRRFRKTLKKMHPDIKPDLDIRELHEEGYVEIRISGADSTLGGETCHYEPFFAALQIGNKLRTPLPVVVPLGTIFRSGDPKTPRLVVMTETRAEIGPNQTFDLNVVVTYLSEKGTIPTHSFPLTGVETAHNRLCTFIRRMASEKGLEDMARSAWSKDILGKKYPGRLATMAGLQAGVWMIELALDADRIRKGLHDLEGYHETLDFHENVEGHYEKLRLEMSDAQIEEIRQMVVSIQIDDWLERDKKKSATPEEWAKGRERHDA